MSVCRAVWVRSQEVTCRSWVVLLKAAAAAVRCALHLLMAMLVARAVACRFTLVLRCLGAAASCRFTLVPRLVRVPEAL